MFTTTRNFLKRRESDIACKPLDGCRNAFPIASRKGRFPFLVPIIDFHKYIGTRHYPLGPKGLEKYYSFHIGYGSPEPLAR